MFVRQRMYDCLRPQIYFPEKILNAYKIKLLVILYFSALPLVQLYLHPEGTLVWFSTASDRPF